jgi:hypothetical protein
MYVGCIATNAVICFNFSRSLGKYFILQDPSVQQATGSNQRTGNVDEFNPFADSHQTRVRVQIHYSM